MHDHIRVAVVDDHPIFREGVAYVLGQTSDIKIVAEGATIQDALSICEIHSPDIILLDVSMPGGGIEALRAIRQNHSTVKTVMLTTSEDADDVTTALENGAVGYVVKGCSGSELSHIIRLIQNSHSYVTPTLAARLLSRTKRSHIFEAPNLSQTASLTDRENRVLHFLSQGLMNKEIGCRLELNEKTVKHHMTRIMQKLKVRNRTEVVLVARKSLASC
jgi:two-component system, NarL family, nitrate/nitrite response regulator NarL